jgi:hypothetical protein
MFRCECDEGYALDGSGGELINGLGVLKCCTYSIQMYGLVCFVLGSSDFHDIVHMWTPTHSHTLTHLPRNIAGIANFMLFLIEKCSVQFNLLCSRNPHLVMQPPDIE